MSLEGKVALVTGSGRNIGRSIAIALANDGADVVVHARTNQEEAKSVASEISALGRRSLDLLGDMGDRVSVENIMAKALDTFGRVDIVVNNAAIRPHKSFVEMSYEDWRNVIATDLDAAFLTTKYALPGMIERQWGRVVNFSGLQAFQGRHGGAHISAAKVGIIGLTRALGTELAPNGILVNCIVPGMIDTSREVTTGTRLPGRLDSIPVGRPGDPDEIASLCSFLCSDSNGFITGQTIHANGGERNF
jgi:3-oxoacyl-[acyl-carrier protein] reductase